MSYGRPSQHDVPTDIVSHGATASCNLCLWRETWQSTTVAQWAAVWHVYDNHRDTWIRIAGDREPLDPRPRRDA